MIFGPNFDKHMAAFVALQVRQTEALERIAAQGQAAAELFPMRFTTAYDDAGARSRILQQFVDGAWRDVPSES